MEKNIVSSIVAKPKLLFICLLVLTLLSISAYATPVDLGTAASFGALGGSAVTNTGFTIINGDLGVWPGTSITGFPPGTYTGSLHAGDGVAEQAQSDVTTAYDILAGMTLTQNLTGQDLGGLTLTSGVYRFNTSAQLTGILTLDANNDPNSLFVFQIGSTLTTSNNSSVIVINAPENFSSNYWQIGSSATLGGDTVFTGNILAYTSITLNGGTLNGQALARNGAVTMSAQETITVPVSDSNLAIRIWYGPNQVFAQQGTPQRWVNILGDVINPARVKSLTYSLNGGSQLPLSMGPLSNPRLAGSGDLNVEIACVDLLSAPAQNTIEITATDLNDNVTTASVNCEYFSTNSWPLPYDVNWSTVTDSNLADSNILDAVQIVDGQWIIEPNGLSTVVEGYNRSFVLGDMNNWRDYEVNVPITVHQSYHDGNLPAVGLVLRWTGYYQDANDNNQPVLGNNPIGAAVLFKWSDDSNGQYTIYNHDFNVVGETNSLGTLQPEVTYIFKMRVETTSEEDEGGLYSFKVWRSSQTEPDEWLLQQQEDLNDPQNGSVLFLAHHVDATFGNITVTNTAPLFTLSGHVWDDNGLPVDGVTINGLPGNPVTDVNGLYSAIVSNGWTWSVAPAKTGETFDPTNRSYTDVNADSNSEDYSTGTLMRTISGSADINGVTMSGLPGNPVTDINGFYSAEVPYGWSGTVTPAKTGFTFTPTSRSYTDVTADSNSPNYIASQITFTISGNAGVDGVTMSGLPGNPVTSGGGLYSAEVPYGWDGTATPVKTGFTFTPTSRSYTDVTADSNSQNYTPDANAPGLLPITITKFTVRADRTGTPSRDSFTITGTFDANQQNIAGSTAIYIRLSNANELVFEGVIPYNSAKLKNGKFSYTRHSGDLNNISSASFNLNRHTFHINAKKVNLTGLNCPVYVQIEWGSYLGTAAVNEDIVNGKHHLIPMSLLSGYADTLRIDKASVHTSTKANRDSLIVRGAIAFASGIENLPQHALTLHWGDQDFNVPAGGFVALAHGRYAYASPRGTTTGITKAYFNLEKSIFTFSVKNATIASRTGTVELGITCDAFDQYVAYHLP